MRSVEVLVFEGCPNVELALQRARAALVSTRTEADVRVVRVEDDTSAKRQRFLGSPTIRVDGVDVEPSARERTDFGMQCRVYAVDGRLDGAPPVAWIEAALDGRAIEADVAPSHDCCSPSPSGEK